MFGGLLAACIGVAQAQSIAAGTISLGGGIGYFRNSSEVKYSNGNNTTVTEETTISQFQVSPAVGYFFADNLAVGLNLGYNSLSGRGNKQSNFRVGPYVQYYKMVSEQFGVLGTLGAGYTSIKDYSKGFYAAVTPGVIFFPVPKFGVSASIGNLGYERSSRDNGLTSNKASLFGASFGLNQLLFGGTYYFGR